MQQKETIQNNVMENNTIHIIHELHINIIQ